MQYSLAKNVKKHFTHPEFQSFDSNGNSFDFNCKIFGWGKTEAAEQDIIRRLKFAEVNVISFDECVNQLNMLPSTLYLDKIGVCSALHICSIDPENKKGTCIGDSGGPLVCNGMLVGVVSHGTSENCAVPHSPDIYSRVDIHLGWIKRIMSGDKV